jgi:nucleotide-binding universal stress UspA family protein
MKNILIPTDFSAFSKSAMRTGAYIASKTDATVHLLNVFQAPEDWNRLSVQQQQRFPEIEGRMVDSDMKLEKLSKEPLFTGLDVRTTVLGGSAYRMIIDYAEKHKIDLIVMGAHGMNELEGPFIGSTAQKVVRVAPCLVLSVKRNFKPASLKKIVFPSNFAEPDLAKSFKYIKNFAQDIGAKVDFVHINTPYNFHDTESTEKSMREFATPHRDLKPGFFIQNDFTTEAGIVNVSKKIKANMVALVTHNRKGRSNYLLGVTETVLLHSDIPVLSQVM